MVAQGQQFCEKSKDCLRFPISEQ